MSIVNKFRSYIAAFDGSNRDFNEVSQLFEELYHQDFMLEQGGNLVSREQMKQCQIKGLELGSKATLLHFSTHPNEGTIEFKFQLSNDHYNIVIHNVAIVKDNKIIRATPVQETKPLLLVNLEAYFAACDGTPRDFSSVSHLFDKVFHDEFLYQFGNDPYYYDKKHMQQAHSNFFALGSKATLLLFKDVGSDQVEYKFRMDNGKVDVVVHNIATVKDSKFIKAKPVVVSSLESVSRIHEASELYEASVTDAEKGGKKSGSETGFESAATMIPQ